jgi:hypothetical protein
MSAALFGDLAAHPSILVAGSAKRRTADISL